MSIDLELDDAQHAIQDAVARFCTDREESDFSRELWRDLAGLGVLALATPEGAGGAREAVAALEALGAATFPGPLPATFLATQLLPERERMAVADGSCLVSLGEPPLLPWAPVADLFLAAAEPRVRRGEPRGEIVPVRTLGGEPWGRVELTAGEPLEPARRAFALHDLALAAYAAAAGRALVEAAADHARTRTQFGRPIGEFQAVSHPLADAAMRLGAAGTLARGAACAFDAEPDAAATRTASAAARLSARGAALDAAHVSHQVFGALGITLEGPVFRRSRRLRQLASQPPADTTAREQVLAPFLQGCA